MVIICQDLLEILKTIMVYFRMDHCLNLYDEYEDFLQVHHYHYALHMHHNNAC
jgi:hypothetical protein